MKLLLENWRQYLSEEVEFRGILKLKLNPEIMAQAIAIQETLPPEAVPLPGKALHITLAHQSVLKKYRPLLKKLTLPPEPAVILAPGYEEMPVDDFGRKSWRVRVTEKNQEELKAYVNQVMAMVKGPPNPEPNRVFHISLANLTGNAGDSVR